MNMNNHKAIVPFAAIRLSVSKSMSIFTLPRVSAFSTTRSSTTIPSTNRRRRRWQSSQSSTMNSFFDISNDRFRSYRSKTIPFSSTRMIFSLEAARDDEDIADVSDEEDDARMVKDINHYTTKGRSSTTKRITQQIQDMSLLDIQDEITQCNHGIPVNVQSPKQVSMAIFDKPLVSTGKLFLQQILEDHESDTIVATTTKKGDNSFAFDNISLSKEKIYLIRLILQCRDLLKKERECQMNKQNIKEYIDDSNEVENDDNISSDILSPSNSINEATNEDNIIPSEEKTSPTYRIKATSFSTFEQQVDSLFDRPYSQLHTYWRERTKRISRPSARELLRQLDPTECPMGYDPRAAPKGKASAASTAAGKKGSFLAFCRDQKRLYPQCIILTRMGDFYETFGLDAVFLVEYAFLNPMGGKAKAGCPYRNVQATINALVEQGFSVAVYEEVGQTASNKLKTRVLAQTCTPASPTYFFDHNWLLGTEHDSTAALDHLPPSRPCVGIVHTAAGYHMIECSLEELSVRYSERMTSEAVVCRLAAYPPAEPLVYIPSPSESALSRSEPKLKFLPQSSRPSTLTERELGETHLGGYGIQTVTIPPSLIPNSNGPESERYISVIIDTLLQWNRRQDHNLQDSEIALTAASRRPGGTFSENRPTMKDFTIARTYAHTHPLYLETASQLGLLQDPTIPSLIDSVLDEAAPVATRRFLKRYMLVPPPPDVAKAMGSLVSSLIEDQSDSYSNATILPRLVIPPLGKILSLIRAGQASAAIYGELLHALAVTRFVLSSNEHKLPVDSLLKLCSHESGLLAERELLFERCQQAIDVIESVICPSHHVEDELLQLDKNEFKESSAFCPEDAFSAYKHIPRSFVERNEMSWRGRVQQSIAQEAYLNVEAKGQELDEAIRKDFLRDDEANRALIAQDIFNNLLVLKKLPSDVNASDFIHPRDRHGKKLGSRFSTENVEQAISNYVAACDNACEEVSNILSGLASRLQDEGHIPAIIQSAHMNLALSVAYHHAVKAIKQKWELAEVIESDCSSENMSVKARFVDLWPYWMPQQHAVSNTFDLEGMFLLTAPNMSGKSTLMRSTAAAALLSVCGLCAPLKKESSITRFDTLFLRGASSDVPAENKSAFGAEMEDISALMRCSGSRSLVFVDEIGRGTSPRDGTRLAAAILEMMVSQGMSGIFATHLHDILKLPLREKSRIMNKQMAIQKSEQNNLSSYKWTYRIEDGVCTDSLAMATAAKFGLPDEIIQRAEEFDLYLHQGASNPESMQNEIEVLTPCENNDSTISQTNDPGFIDAINVMKRGIDYPEITIPRRANPPPSLANKSCVYLLELGCNPPRFYVGETDSLFQRLEAHRKKGRFWSNARVAVFPVSSKTEARRIESESIQALAQAGFSMESTRDGRTLRP